MFETLQEYFKQLLLLPENPNQKQWERIFKDMAVHTRMDIPKDLLLKRRPNEDPLVHTYRLENYEPITYGSMNKAIDDLYRILNGINYSIQAEDSFKEFINKARFQNFSADTQNEELDMDLFLQKIVLKRMIEDPNGFLIWFPTGAGLTDSSQQVVPQPKLIYSHQYTYSDANVFIYLSDEKSALTSGKTVVMEGDIYYFFTRTEIWKMYQTGSMDKKKWVQQLVYTHNLGMFPIIILGGDMNSAGYYNSFFSPYLAFGNEAIRQYSDWQAVMTTSSFPYREEFLNECSFHMVNEQSQNIPDQEEKFSGKVRLVPISKSPYNVIQRKIPSKNMNDDALDVGVPSLRFISPDINVAKYSGESWEKLIELAEKALNIDMNVGVNQSGVAKQIDKEAQYSMITKIGTNFFDHIYTNSLRIIDAYINAKPFDYTVNIIKPATFWIKNEDDLVNEITVLKEKNVPSFFLAEATLDLAKKRFAGNPVAEKIFIFISLYDPLYIYTIDEKNTLVASTVVTKETSVRSIYMYGILNQIVKEMTPKVFLETDLSDIKTEFDKLIIPYLPAAAPQQFDANGNLIDASGNIISNNNFVYP
jgi:hypothetical protein